MTYIQESRIRNQESFIFSKQLRYKNNMTFELHTDYTHIFGNMIPNNILVSISV